VTVLFALDILTFVGPSRGPVILPETMPLSMSEVSLVPISTIIIHMPVTMFLIIFHVPNVFAVAVGFSMLANSHWRRRREYHYEAHGRSRAVRTNLEMCDAHRDNLLNRTPTSAESDSSLSGEYKEFESE
jgi:hypothetical protein